MPRPHNRARRGSNRRSQGRSEIQLDITKVSRALKGSWRPIVVVSLSKLSRVVSRKSREGGRQIMSGRWITVGLDGGRASLTGVFKFVKRQTGRPSAATNHGTLFP